MKSIWKFPVANKDSQQISMPIGAHILCVQTQNDEPQLWAICDTNMQVRESRAIAIYGTGHPMPDNPGKYIGTFQLAGGRLVFHAFEV